MGETGMKKLSGRQTKMLACMIAAGLAVNFAGAAPANAKAKATTEGTTQSVEAEIADLTQRLNDLEAQLKAVKASEKATKEQVKKAGKSKNGLIKWSGSTKSGYWSESNSNSKFKAEFKLNGEADIGDGYKVDIGLKFKSTTEDAATKKGKYKYGYEKNKILLNAANVSKRFWDKLNVKIGTQKAEVGEGLWIAKGGTNQMLAEYNFTPRDILRVSYGYDSHDYLAERQAGADDPTQTRLLHFFEYRHDFSKDAYAGIYSGYQQPEKYLGIYGATPVVGKLWVSGEFVRNSNTDKPAMNDYEYGYDYYKGSAETRGYMFNLNYGKAKKKGSWGASLQWLNVDQNLFMDDNYTDLDDYIDQDGFKGLGLSFAYALSDRAKLELIRYWGTTKPSTDWTNAKGKSLEAAAKNSIYLKFTTKF